MVAADVGSWVASGLTPGVTYEFRVRARTGNAVSGWSNRAIVTLPPLRLTRPNQLQAMAWSPIEARLEWNDRSDGEGSFEIDLRTPSGPWTRVLRVGAEVSQAALTGLTWGGTYSFRVRARRGGAVSGWSNKATVVLPDG